MLAKSPTCAQCVTPAHRRGTLIHQTKATTSNEALHNQVTTAAVSYTSVISAIKEAARTFAYEGSSVEELPVELESSPVSFGLFKPACAKILSALLSASKPLGQHFLQ